MNRNDVTEKIITVKVSKGIKWETVARKVGLSKEWTTAACLGQMTLTGQQAKVVAGRAVQGLVAHAGADRSADLSLV
jgi:cyanate lyase